MHHLRTKSVDEAENIYEESAHRFFDNKLNIIIRLANNSNFNTSSDSIKS